MPPIYRMMALLALVFPTLFADAQNFWQPLNGPNGLRNVREIAADGSSRLFMTIYDQIFCSTDNGASWTLCQDGLDDLTVSTFDGFIRHASGELYLFIAYYQGLFRYDAAANTWVLMPGTAAFDGVGIDPQGRIWGSRDEWQNKIHYSDNGGASFQQIPLSAPVNGWFNSLAAFNDEHNLVAVGYGSEFRIYHFTLSGEVTQVADTYGMNCLAFNPHTGMAYYSGNNDFKRSATGGLSWENLTLEPGTSYQPSVIKMYFETNGTNWAVTNESVYRSEDDGLNWTKQVSFSEQPGKYFQTVPGHWFSYRDCALYRSDDDGVNWTDMTVQFRAPYVSDIQINALGTLYARNCYRDVSDIYEKSTDEGQTWAVFTVFDSAETTVSSLAARPDGFMLAVGSDGRLFRSFDNGANWQKIPNPGSPFGQEFAKVYVDYNGALYHFSDGGSYRSHDNGDSWQALNMWSGYGEPAFHPNGDIYFSDGFSFILYYDATANASDWMELEGLVDLERGSVHCTRSGLVLLSFLGADGIHLYRMAGSNAAPELLPFTSQIASRYVFGSNGEGDIFLVADNRLHKSEDGGLNWTDLGPMPNDDGTPVLYVSNDQYLYAGLFNAVIHRSAEPTAASNFILGQIWVDADGDCQPDAGEPGVPNLVITAEGNGDYVGFSGYDGHFVLSAASGAYLVNVKPPNELFAPCFTDVPVVLNGPNDTIFADLPLQVAALCPYLSVNLSTPFLRRCFNNTYTIRYRNEGTAVAADAYLEVTLDSFFIFQSASLPVAAQSGLTYAFQLGDLAPGQSGVLQVVVKVDCNAAPGQEHCVTAHIYPDDLCLPTLESLTEAHDCRANIGAFDPNDKHAFVDGREDPALTLPNTEIEYLIRFQNTGTDTAFRVVVEDRISTLLDLATLTPLVSSHPFSLEMADQRTVQFVFDDISLPDSTTNADASNGFIKFRIAQMPDVPPGSVIRNQADIFFDFNAPVTTNESAVTIGTVGYDHEAGPAYTLRVYPNPFDESVTFRLENGSPSGEIVSLRLFDTLGQLAARETFSGNSFTLPRRNLPVGWYFFLLEIKGERIGVGKIRAF